MRRIGKLARHRRQAIRKEVRKGKGDWEGRNEKNISEERKGKWRMEKRKKKYE